MSSIRIINTQVLSDQKYKLEKVTFEHTLPSGEKEVQEREVFSRGDATAILLYDAERKKVLLTEQLRLPVYLHENHHEHLLEACAGLIDEGEFPEHAIVREVEEETGYRISHISKIAEAYSSPGAYCEYVHYFTGEYSPDLKVAEGGGMQHEGEDVRTVELSYEEARNLLSSGKIRDAKTIILLQYAIIHNLI